ncbi:MAG: hypothetical protein CL820_13815 [Croceicoccus sp.]|nr:hypothetical protein [Croceicoccus sp.]MAL26937.1 hypothetical protein [Croceicoccus sp.]|tara:strand:- start:18091 stop:18324 length:234 start_codon:yes stop_codon:yes gene_type:complete
MSIYDELADEVFLLLEARMAERGTEGFEQMRDICAALTGALWRTSQCLPFKLAPEEYVAMLRAHADDMERLHCGPKH